MADVKTSAETAATAVLASDLIRIVQAGANLKATTAQLKTFIRGGVFDPYDYGCVGDGSTDDTTNFAAMITAFNAAGGGLIEIPKGIIKTSGGFTITAKCTIRGRGCGDDTGANAISQITCTSATAYLLTFTTADGANICDLSLLNTAAGTPSAGGGIRFTNGSGSRVNRCVVKSFYDGIIHSNSREWYMAQTLIQGFVRYGVSIANAALPDGGDWHISDCEVMAQTNAATTGVYITSGGGGHITGLKVNVRSGSLVHAIEMAIVTGTNTSLLQIANSSLENTTGSPIYARVTSTGSWNQLTFCGVQMNTSGAVPCIDLDGGYAGGMDTVTITGCIMRGTGAVSAISPIKVRNLERLTMAGNQELGNYPQAKLDVASIAYLHNCDRNGEGTLASGATVAIDLANFDGYLLTLATNATLSNPTNPTGGQTFAVRITNNGTPHTLGYDTKYKFPGGTAPTLTAVANAKDLLVCQWDGATDTYACNLTKAYA